jgi:hypothetical protein
MRPPLQKGHPDDFQTPPEALRPLLPYLEKGCRVWECAAGKGYLVEALRQQGYSVVASDKERSFLIWQPAQFDCIVTNPPYSLKNQFLERAYSFGKPFAFLLPLTTLETVKRQSLFRRHGLEIILLDKRIHFETPNAMGSNSWFATAWFTHGLGIGRQLTFASLSTQSPKPYAPILQALRRL